MEGAKFYVADRNYDIRQYWIGSRSPSAGSARTANNDYHFIVNGTDDSFLFAWCATGEVKPAAKLVLACEEGTYETSFEQVSCPAYSLGNNSQDPNNMSVIYFDISAEVSKTVVVY